MGKASGKDNIELKLIKWIGEEGKCWLHTICKDAWENKAIPKDWKII